MFDIGWSEILVIAVVAIVVVGPKDLPRALRAVGHWTSKARRMAGDFQRQFNEAIREAELDDFKKTVTDVKKQVTDIGKIDPIGDVRKEMSKAEAGIRSDLDKATRLDAPKASEPAPEPEPVVEPETEATASVDGEPAAPPSPMETAAPPTSVPATTVAAGEAKP